MEIIKSKEVDSGGISMAGGAKTRLSESQQNLEIALPKTSQLSDKPDGMLTVLASTLDQVKYAELVSTRSDIQIQEQMQENQAVDEDLEKSESILTVSVKWADDKVLSDPAV